MKKPHHQETFGAELEFPSEAPVPAPTPAPSLGASLIGTIVANRYLVHRLLGHGGMGAVYEAEHVQLKKRVALKVLHGHMSAKAEVQARFEREAVAAGRIAHPGVVAATDFGRLPDGSFYLVLEHVDGESLASVLSRTPILPVERVFRVMVQICSALSAAHAQGIVHRDLKPENIMLVAAGDEDLVKVLDFGIAQVQMDEGGVEGQRLTKAGLVFGTPEYMSPEQARGVSVDQRSDLYALGMLGYEMLAGRSAFRADDIMAILTAQMADPPPPLPPAVPAPLADLIRSLLAKDPADRPQSADELFEQLTGLSERLGISMPAPRTVGARRFLHGNSPLFIGSTALASIRVLSMRPQATAGLPIWVPLLALLLGVAAGAFFVLREPGAPRGQAALLEAAPPVAEPVETDLLLKARAGDRDALGAVRKLVEGDRAALAALTSEGPEAKRSEAAEAAAQRQVERFRALGEGYHRIRHYSGVLSSYEDAVALSPQLAEDEEVLIAVRVALGQRDAVEDGLAFAVKLGSPGADMVYDLWVAHRGQPGKTPVVARAMKLIKGGELRELASPALQIAMDLEQAQVCAEYKRLLPRATRFADDRSLPTLKALRARKGCGAGARSDCFLCLRAKEAELEDAIAASSIRPGPEFLKKVDVLDN